MQAEISQALIKKLTARPVPYEVCDTEVRGFILRVQPSGVMTYICRYAEGKRITLGRASLLKPAKARDRARDIISGYVYTGEDPMEARKELRAHTLESFVAEKYGPWVEANMRQPKEALRKIASFYPEFGKKKLLEVSAFIVEKHRSARLKSGTSPSTVNREIDSLRAVLNKAVQWGMLRANPMAAVKRSRVDSLATVRYLSDDEDKRLRETLELREARRRQDRGNFNAWRRERGYKEFPTYGTFTDHLKPLVLLALNSGLRRGELFNLRWPDINFVGRILTVAGKTAKSGKTRHIPLNDEAFDVLQKWYQQRKQAELVFPGYDSGRLDNISTSWEHLMRDAKIAGFRFHDLRHDFASKLVMKGVDLNTVRELLGHSDIKMTLRYAHLAPAKLAAAVAQLAAK